VIPEPRAAARIGKAPHQGAAAPAPQRPPDDVEPAWPCPSASRLAPSSRTSFALPIPPPPLTKSEPSLGPGPLARRRITGSVSERPSGRDQSNGTRAFPHCSCAPQGLHAILVLGARARARSAAPASSAVTHVRRARRGMAKRAQLDAPSARPAYRDPQGTPGSQVPPVVWRGRTPSSAAARRTPHADGRLRPGRCPLALRATSSNASRRSALPTCSRRWSRARAGRSSWPAAIRATRCPSCARGSRAGTTSTRPTRRRGRLLVAEACRALGDEDSAALELEAAARSSPARPGGPGRAALRLAEAVPGRRIRNAMAP
jgi:hypothetical protein